MASWESRKAGYHVDSWAFALAHGQAKDSDLYFLMYGSATI